MPLTSNAVWSAPTLIEGTTFCISAATGDIEPGAVQGLFVRDTRFCSGLVLRVDGALTEGLSFISSEPFAGTYVSRVRPGPGGESPALLVVRTRHVGDGMREDLQIRNLANRDVEIELSIEFAADFAHVYDVKGDHVHNGGARTVEAADGRLIFSFADRGRTRRLVVLLPEGALVNDGVATLKLAIGARQEWSSCFCFEVALDGRAVEPRLRCGELASVSIPSERLRQWRWQTPRVHVDHESFSVALARSAEDLAALRILDPDHPDEPVLAAGAPWYMALFGRDSLISSWMTLPVDPRIATGTLRQLARRQGDHVDLATEEQPGKILHELRFRDDGPAHGQLASAYFGSIDATPLFVMTLGEAANWGLSRDVVAELLPHADRALEWVAEYGDRDGDGFVEYQALSARGFPNQGWKDSPDGVSFASGALARTPIALCEVQGYVYAAYVARRELATALGDAATAQRYDAKAVALRRAFNEAFFLPERGYYAVGLDGDKNPIDSLASNMGHLLWTGIVDDEHAGTVARHLVSPELFSGWGVRTLARPMGRYDPMSYHNGSVWPHDSAIAAAGLMRYGYVAEAQRIALGVIDAAGAIDGRLPELFCGFDRAEFADPIAYPTACSPQAWAGMSVYLLLRTLLRLDARVPEGAVYFAPALPPEIASLRMENMPLGGDRVTIQVSAGAATLEPVPAGLTVLTRPAPVSPGH